MPTGGVLRRKRGTSSSWTSTQIDEQNKLIALIGRLTAEGKDVPRSLWIRLERLSRAVTRDVKDGDQGPAQFNTSYSASRNALSTVRNAPAFSMGRPTKSSDVLPVLTSSVSGSRRLRVRPDALRGDSREGPGFMAPTSFDKAELSKFRSAPKFSLRSRIKEPESRDPGPDISVNPSSFGQQMLSTTTSGGRAVFSHAPRFGGRAAEEDDGPSVYSYNPKYSALSSYPSPQRAVLLGNSMPEYNPFLDTRAAPGSYEIPSGFGLQSVADRGSAPAYAFGREDGLSSLRLQTYASAHDRGQPMGVRSKSKWGRL